MRNRTVVDAPAACDWLHVVLGNILGDAHRSKNALAVICGTRRYYEQPQLSVLNGNLAASSSQDPGGGAVTGKVSSPSSGSTW